MKLNLFSFCKVLIIIFFVSGNSLIAGNVHPRKKLPIIELVAHGNSDMYAIFLTGDFGYLNFDKAIVRYLNSKNISVVVLNSKNYYWSKKSPAQLGRDLGSIMNQYDKKWSRKKVVLMGYSMGAEVLPFAINQLDEKSKAQVTDVILIGPSQKAIFRLKPTDYLFEDKKGTEIYGELVKMKGQRSYIICDDHINSICRKNLEGISDHDFLAGGHHFGHNYAALSKLIGKRLNLK